MFTFESSFFKIKSLVNAVSNTNNSVKNIPKANDKMLTQIWASHKKMGNYFW